MGVASDITRDSMSQQPPWSSGSYNLSVHSSTVISQCQVQKLYCRCSHWDWSPYLLFCCFIETPMPMQLMEEGVYLGLKL